jgi:hypothetical protein
MSDIKPHPQNALGDYYVEYGCCTACEVPFSEAPDLFEYDDSCHCFVRRQPTTDEETNQMLSAIACAELQCIRYRGTDPKLFDRFAAMGEVDICDNPPAGFKPAIRNHVAFKATTSAITLKELVALFTAFLEKQTTDSFRYKIKRPRIRGDSASLQFATRLTIPGIRHKGAYDTITFQTLDASNTKGDFCAVHEDESSPGQSIVLQRWLTNSEQFDNMMWFTKIEWNAIGSTGHKDPC